MNSQGTANPLFASLGVINKARPLDTTHIINWLELLSLALFWVVLAVESLVIPENRPFQEFWANNRAVDWSHGTHLALARKFAGRGGRACGRSG